MLLLSWTWLDSRRGFFNVNYWPVIRRCYTVVVVAIQWNSFSFYICNPWKFRLSHLCSCLFNLKFIFRLNLRQRKHFWCSSTTLNTTANIFSRINRPRVPPHSERGITSLTPAVAAAVRFLTTSKRSFVLLVVTQIRRWGTSIGDKRQRAVVPLERDVWNTWRPSPDDSRTDSERELKPKSRSPPPAKHIKC